MAVPTMGPKHWWPQFPRATRGKKWAVPRQWVAYVNLEGQEIPARHSLTCGLVFGTPTVYEGPQRKSHKCQ